MNRNRDDRPRYRQSLLRFLALAIGALVGAACVEAILRTLPVSDALRTTAVNARNPVIRFEPEREITWSRDWNFSLVNRVKFNNYGFVSDFDYDPDARGPLLAVIGDSYVEALMVPFPETCAGRLAAGLHGARVYAFGMSGAPLSQYLVFAEYARTTFRPDAIAIVVISNDYDESLMRYGRKPGMHQFLKRGDGRLVLERSDLKRGRLYTWGRRIALARYLAVNLDILNLGSNVHRAIHGPPDRRGRESESRRAVDAFFDRLPAAAGLPPDRITFVVDGVRPALYHGDEGRRPRDGYEDLMRRYFMSHAVRRGYGVIDMQPLFVRHYRIHGQRFEWPQDAHWNALGHGVCADALQRSLAPLPDPDR